MQNNVVKNFEGSNSQMQWTICVEDWERKTKAHCLLEEVVPLTEIRNSGLKADFLGHG